MVRVMLVAEAWTRVVDVQVADDVIDAEGMTWERDRDSDDDPPRYVPSIGA
jgi:hypothetical protein